MSRATRALALAGIAASVLTGVSCGGDGSSGAPIGGVRPAVAQLQQAFAEEDASALCARMTRAAMRQAGTDGHGKVETCVKDVDQIMKGIEKQAEWVDRGKARLVSIESDGDDRALARMSLPQGDFAVPFAFDDGRWKLDSFFGVREDVAKEASSDLFPPPPEDVEGATVTVDDGVDGRSCPEPLTPTSWEEDHSCSIYFQSEDLDVTILTLFGGIEMGTCSSSYDMQVSASGETASQGGIFAYPQACADLNICGIEAVGPIPLRGRITAADNGDLIHSMRVCFNTCVGYFSGDLDMRLVDKGIKWRADVENTMAGSSGIVFDGTFSVSPLNIGIEEDEG